MCGATGVTIQPHQILRLPRRKTRMLYPRHIWNVIYIARSNRCHDPPSPNTAPAMQNDTPKFQGKSSKTGDTSFTMRGRSENDPTMIREWSDRQSATRLATEVIFRPHHQHFLLKNTTFRAQAFIQKFTKCCTCHEKWHLNFPKRCACHADRFTCFILVTYETLFTLRGATGASIQPHQILCLSGRKNPRAESSSHMKRHLQCAEQQVSGSNLTKYCACHEMTLQNFRQNFRKQVKRLFPMWGRSENDLTMIREWSDHIRPWNRQSATRLATEVIYRAHPQHVLLKNTTFRAQAFIQKFTKCCTCHEKWHLKFPKCCTCHEKWHLNFPKYPSAAPATKRATGPSSTGLYPTRLYSTWLYSTWRYSTRLYSTWLYPTWLCSTWFYSTWLFSTWLYSTWLFSLLDSWLYLTLDSTYLTLDSTWLYSAGPYPTGLYPTWPFPTWLYSTSFYSTGLYPTWHYSTWRDSTWLYSTCLYSTLLYLTLLYLTLLYLTLLYLTLLYLTLDSTWLLTLLDSWLYLTLDSTWLCSTWLYSAGLYPTGLYSTWLFSTWLYSTWHYFTWLYSTWHHSDVVRISEVSQLNFFD